MIEVLLASLWQGAFIFVIAAGVTALVPRRHAATRYAVWFVSLMALVILPLIAQLSFDTPSSTIFSSVAQTTSAISKLTEQTSSEADVWFAVIWGVGLVACIVRFTISYFRLGRILRSVGPHSEIGDRSGADGACGSGCYLTNLDGTLYGTAYNGGKAGIGSVFSIKPGGTFKMLYSASGKGDTGGYPRASLTKVGGTLYGTMSDGPHGKRGTVFSVTTRGSVKTIFQFGGGIEGANPRSNLTLVGGKLYGTTEKGGSNDQGTIYSISGF
jgi:uncharacterized repeat protein (TIGR03803 family)